MIFVWAFPLLGLPTPARRYGVAGGQRSMFCQILELLASSVNCLILLTRVQYSNDILFFGPVK